MTTQNQRSVITLDQATVDRARELARTAAEPVVTMARTHTTVSVERATLRLAGLAGADTERIPWVNHLVDAVRGQVGLEHGVCLPVWDALARDEAADLVTLAQKAAVGSVSFRLPSTKATAAAATRAARGAVAA
ncbi:MAG TPA: lysine 5,6-aminomutase subunit alpha, partial [Kineosporiaceae bacterium]|nr:lysine 5,6-aminomutase subunit alpha [Kineosporiaceae bacterium]